ncbi:MAG: hypothetical protein ACRCST_00650 [Turicibacter sp.]
MEIVFEEEMPAGELVRVYFPNDQLDTNWIIGNRIEDLIAFFSKEEVAHYCVNVPVNANLTLQLDNLILTYGINLVNDQMKYFFNNDLTITRKVG